MTSKRGTRGGGGWLQGATLGLVAAAANVVSIPLLGESAPPLLLGKAFVYVAVARLGARGAMVAASVMAVFLLADPGGWGHPGLAVGTLLPVVEAGGVAFLYGRFRSLVLAGSVYWFTVGWALAGLLYVGWMGLPVAFLALVVVAGVLGALAAAVMAELLLVPRILRRLPPPLGGPEARLPLGRFVFSRLALAVAVPALLLSTLYARARFRGDLELARSEAVQTAGQITTDVYRYLEERTAALGRTANFVQAARGDTVQERAALTDLAERFPEFRVVAVVDDADVLRASHPRANAEGQVVEGSSLAGRDYLVAARRTGQTALGGLAVARLRFGEQSDAPVVVMAEPFLHPDGSYGGAVVAGLDTHSLRAPFQARLGSGGYRVTLLDADGRVLTSTDPAWPPGVRPDTLVSIAEAQVGGPDPLAPGGQVRSFTYRTPYTGAVAERLGLDVVHATYLPLSLAGWGLLVALPTTVLQEQFVPSAAWILGLVTVLLLLVAVLARQFAVRIATPVRLASEAVQRVAEAPLAEVDAAGVAGSGLVELDQLEQALRRVQEILRTRAVAVRVRQEELEAQLLQARKMEAVALLAGGVAHDFNNLLTPVLAHAELAMEAVRDPDVRESLQEIRQSAERGRELTRRLLVHGRRQVLAVERTEVPVEMEEVEVLLRSLFRADVELDVEVDETTRPIAVDRVLFRQIFVNLALNAQEAMPRGGRARLRVGNEPAGGEGELDGPGVRIEFHDDGQGMERETLERAFEPFFTTKGPGQGVGLGLSTVYGIVQRHSGKIRATSEPGRGTSIRIVLPVLDEAGTQDASGDGAIGPDASE